MTQASEERLSRLHKICLSLHYEIQSPHDCSVEEALLLIHLELSELSARHCYGPEVEEKQIDGPQQGVGQ